MQRDRLDFGTMNVSYLFRKMFIPTLLGMVLSATINIADGIFVGNGVGSDALAAVNIVAPFFMTATGVGLMFGTGASIVSSIHLSQNNFKAANIVITQALTVSLAFVLILAIFTYTNLNNVAFALGSSEQLLPYVTDYIKYVIPSLIFTMILCIGLFIVRLDGSPTYAMLCNTVPAIINFFLDYLFIYILDYGIAGAAIASSLSELVGFVMFVIYMFKYSQTLHLYRPKFTSKGIRLTLRNIRYMVTLGVSVMIGELAVASMMIVGNYVFINRLGEDGVAAFSIACYCFPIVFMVGNGIAQSAQPIISYNLGCGNMQRANKAFHLSLIVAFTCGIISFLGGQFFNVELVSLFMGSQSPAHDLAIAGIPYFSLSFVFFILNITCIGYYQSIKRYKNAIVFMVLRGFVFMLAGFLILPDLLGVKGIWLAVPFSESLTFIIIVVWYLTHRKSHANSTYTLPEAE